MTSAPLIILAAGNSSRMGQPKGLARVNGEALWLWSVRQYVRAGGKRVVLVLGEDEASYFRECPLLATAKPAEVAPDWLFAGADVGLRVARNPDPSRGPMSSLQLGLALAGGPSWILPVDCPGPRPETWAELQNAFEKGLCVQPTFEGRGGHPVGIGPDLAERILGLESQRIREARLDLMLRELSPEQLLRLPVNDARVRLSFNTPDEWQGVVRELSSS